jgi:integrase
LKRENIVVMMDRLSDQPVAANALLKMLRVLMKHAVDTGFRQDNPARDISAIRIKSEGYHSLTEEEIAQFEATHPIGSPERLAFALLLHTGQRRGDVIRMGPQHIRDGFLHVKQSKTGAELWIPVTPQLQEIIAASPVNQLTFIVRRTRQTVHRDRFQQLVPQSLRQGRVASLHCTRTPQSGRTKTRGGRMQRARDQIHYRPRQP